MYEIKAAALLTQEGGCLKKLFRETVLSELTFFVERNV